MTALIIPNWFLIVLTIWMVLYIMEIIGKVIIYVLKKRMQRQIEKQLKFTKR